MTLTLKPLTRSYLRFSALLTVLGLSGQAALASQFPVFKAVDVFEIKYAKDPQVSPNGSRVAH